MITQTPFTTLRLAKIIFRERSSRSWDVAILKWSVSVGHREKCHVPTVHTVFYVRQAASAPGYTLEDSINHYFRLSYSSSTHFTLSMCFVITTHCALHVLHAFAPGFILSLLLQLTHPDTSHPLSSIPPLLPSLWWWQRATSPQVGPQFGSPGLPVSLPTPSDFFSSLLLPLAAADKCWYQTATPNVLRYIYWRGCLWLMS